jgi:hypothetical protein
MDVDVTNIHGYPSSDFTVGMWLSYQQDEVKKVLISCIGYLIELKDRIRRLVIFFDNLSSMIDLCVTKQVLPFKKELEVYNQVNKTKAELYKDCYRDVSPCHSCKYRAVLF